MDNIYMDISRFAVQKSMSLSLKHPANYLTIATKLIETTKKSPIVVAFAPGSIKFGDQQYADIISLVKKCNDAEYIKVAVADATMEKEFTDAGIKTEPAESIDILLDPIAGIEEAMKTVNLIIEYMNKDNTQQSSDNTTEIFANFVKRQNDMQQQIICNTKRDMDYILPSQPFASQNNNTKPSQANSNIQDNIPQTQKKKKTK